MRHDARAAADLRPKATRLHWVPSGRHRTLLIVATVEHPITELDEQDGLALLDRQTRKYLGISAEDFVARWENGDLRESDDANVQRLSVLIPFGRAHSR